MLPPNYLSHVADDAVAVLEEFLSEVRNGQASSLRLALLNNDDLRRIIRDKKITDLSTLAKYNKRVSLSIEATMLSVLATSQENLVAALKAGGLTSNYYQRYEQYAGLLTNTAKHTAQSSLEGLVAYANRQNVALSTAAHTNWMRTVDTYVTQANLQLMNTDEAVKAGLKDLAAYGLEWVDYTSGHKDRADVALRRVLRTEANQTGARITENWLDVLDIDLVETSAHMGARPEHFTWQGKVFSRSGAGGYPDFIGSTGYGTVTGLCGANCRHSFGPYFEEAGPTDWGVRVGAKENERIYNLTQKQRAFERNVRAKKRELYHSMPEGVKQAQLQVRLAQKQVREFVKENPELTRDYWREWVSKFKPDIMPDMGPLGKLSEMQRSGLTWYTNKNESRFLRDLFNGPFGAKNAFSNFFNAAQNMTQVPKVFSKVRGLFSAMRKASLSSDMILYRGIDKAYLKGTRNIKGIAAQLTRIASHGGSTAEISRMLSMLDDEINTGKVFYDDKSFISTSKTIGAASGFGNILCEFRVPRGTKGIDVQGLSHKPLEYEVLLNRGTKAKLVHSVYNEKTHSIKLIFEVLR